MRQCCPACASTKSPDPFFRCGWLFTFSVTDFQAIPAGILEKNGVINGFPGLGSFVRGAFDAPGSGADSDRRQPIHRTDAVRPKRDPTLVGTVVRRLCDAEKLGRAILSFGLEL